MNKPDYISIGKLMQAFGLSHLEGKRLLFEMKGLYAECLEDVGGKKCSAEGNLKATVGRLIDESLADLPPSFRYDSPEYNPADVTHDNYHLVGKRNYNLLMAATEQSGDQVFIHLDSRLHLLRLQETNRETPSPLRAIIEKAVVVTTVVDKRKALLRLHQSDKWFKRSVPGLTEEDVEALVPQKKPHSKKRALISIKNAAALLGVNGRTIINWENGQSTPEGYPGRNDEVAFSVFKNTYRSRREKTRAFNNMCKPVLRGIWIPLLSMTTNEIKVKQK